MDLSERHLIRIRENLAQHDGVYLSRDQVLRTLKRVETLGYITASAITPAEPVLWLLHPGAVYQPGDTGAVLRACVPALMPKRGAATQEATVALLSAAATAGVFDGPGPLTFTATTSRVWVHFAHPDGTALRTGLTVHPEELDPEYYDSRGDFDDLEEGTDPTWRDVVHGLTSRAVHAVNGKVRRHERDRARTNDDNVAPSTRTSSSPLLGTTGA